MQKANCTKTKFDHFINLMSEQKTNVDEVKHEDLFVCIAILNNTLFLKEFLEGFLNQHYPQELMDILVLSSEKYKSEILKSFDDKNMKFK